MLAKGATHRLYSMLHDHWNYAKLDSNGKWLIWNDNEWQSWAIGSDEYFRSMY